MTLFNNDDIGFAAAPLPTRRRKTTPAVEVIRQGSADASRLVTTASNTALDVVGFLAEDCPRVRPRSGKVVDVRRVGDATISVEFLIYDPRSPTRHRYGTRTTRMDSTRHSDSASSRPTSYYAIVSPSQRAFRSTVLCIHRALVTNTNDAAHPRPLRPFSGTEVDTTFYPRFDANWCRRPLYAEGLYCWTDDRSVGCHFPARTDPTALSTNGDSDVM